MGHLSEDRMAFYTMAFMNETLVNGDNGGNVTTSSNISASPVLPERGIAQQEHHVEIIVEIFLMCVVILLLLCSYGLPLILRLCLCVRDCADSASECDCEMKNINVACTCCEDSSCHKE